MQSDVIEIYFSYFLNKIFIVGTQKNSVELSLFKGPYGQKKIPC